MNLNHNAPNCLHAVSEEERLIKVYDYYTETDYGRRWNPLNPGNRQIEAERTRVTFQVLHEHSLIPLGDRRILDCGCGSGEVLAKLQDFGARAENLWGLDIHPKYVQIAHRTYPNVHFECANAEHLEFPNAHFDLVLLCTILSSILNDNMLSSIAAQVCRVLKPGGAILWYDFRYDNPSNQNVRGICKQDIRRLFPEFEVHLRTVTLLPPLARRLGIFTQPLYRLLVSLPPLRTHYLGLLTKRC